ncbi:hypothetical protein DFH09DRAFT_1202422 [Mycena vulgaris]|nr:hypothetical protein DFH09DRAFT_1202422 [Mycena vulgaris]
MGLWTLLGVAVVVCALIWRPEDDDSSQPGQDDGRNTQPHPASSLDSHRPIYGTSTPAPARQPLLPPPHSSHYPSQFRSTPTLPPSDVRIVSAPPLPTHRQTWAVDELPLSSVELRERAAEEAKLMRESRLHSERFGRQGFRDAASKLSQISKEHQRAMEEFNQTASEMIYRENNKDREPHEIDLHGLFVKEAELKVEMAILAAERRGDPRVRVIVGQGLHTADGVAKLKPAMECYIDKMRPHSVQTDSLNPGVLVVSLTLDSPDDQGPTKRTKKARAVGRRRSTRSP